jgi:uncharacterized protein YhaN
MSNEVTEKYLAQMLEGYENHYAQMEQAVEGMEAQLSEAKKQREEVETHIKELKDLLGLGEESETPKLKLVPEVDEELSEVTEE